MTSRSRPTAYEVPDQRGRTVVVTGATSGTGLEASIRLAGAGARVVMTARDRERGERARSRVSERHPGAEVQVRMLDLADLASVRRFAAELARDLDRIDILVNNAGVMAPPHRLETTDGFELQLGTNFLGPFALTMLLLPQLLTAPAPRVATMASAASRFGRIDLDDLQWRRRRYRGSAAYGQSKLADIHLFQHLARVTVERGWALRSTGAHPGLTATNLQTAGASLTPGVTAIGVALRLGVVPAQPVERGTEPLLVAVADPDVPTGAYLGPTGLGGAVGPPGPARLGRRERDHAVGARLWGVAEDLTGTRLPSR